MFVTWNWWRIAYRTVENLHLLMKQFLWLDGTCVGVVYTADSGRFLPLPVSCGTHHPVAVCCKFHYDIRDIKKYLLEVMYKAYFKGVIRHLKHLPIFLSFRLCYVALSSIIRFETGCSLRQTHPISRILEFGKDSAYFSSSPLQIPLNGTGICTRAFGTLQYIWWLNILMKNSTRKYLRRSQTSEENIYVNDQMRCVSRRGVNCKRFWIGFVTQYFSVG
jgi:hypothetical protein